MGQHAAVYGHLDLSLDVITKGIAEADRAESPPTGKVGWQPDISSNLSYVGFRGDHDIGSGYRCVPGRNQIDVSATPGPSPVNQASPGTKITRCRGARLAQQLPRIAGGFGALKLGKTDAP